MEARLGDMRARARASDERHRWRASMYQRVFPVCCVALTLMAAAGAYYAIKS